MVFTMQLCKLHHAMYFIEHGVSITMCVPDSICGNVIRHIALMGFNESNMLQMAEPILVQVAPFSLHCSSKATDIQHAIHEYMS